MGACSQVLMSLETVQYLLQHHTPDHFPFLTVPANSRHRTSFHATLARLILSVRERVRMGLTSSLMTGRMLCITQVMDEMATSFDTFMEPILAVLSQLSSTPDLRSEQAKQAIIGVFRDLR
jgi:exportin-7